MGKIIALPLCLGWSRRLFSSPPYLLSPFRRAVEPDSNYKKISREIIFCDKIVPLTQVFPSCSNVKSSSQLHVASAPSLLHTCEHPALSFLSHGCTGMKYQYFLYSIYFTRDQKFGFSSPTERFYENNFWVIHSPKWYRFQIEYIQKLVHMSISICVKQFIKSVSN